MEDIPLSTISLIIGSVLMIPFFFIFHAMKMVYDANKVVVQIEDQAKVRMKVAAVRRAEMFLERERRIQVFMACSGILCDDYYMMRIGDRRMNDMIELHNSYNWFYYVDIYTEEKVEEPKKDSEGSKDGKKEEANKESKNSQENQEETEGKEADEKEDEPEEQQ